MYYLTFIIFLFFNGFSEAGELWTKFNVPYKINCISGDNNYIWLGTSNGIIKLNKIDGFQEIFTKKNGLSDSTIKCIAVDKNGYVYAGAKDKALDINEGCLSFYDGETWINYRKEESGLSGNDIVDISDESENEGVYVATQSTYIVSSKIGRILYKLVKSVQFFKINEFQTIYSATIDYDISQNVNHLTSVCIGDSILFIGMYDNINFYNLHNNSSFNYYNYGANFLLCQNNPKFIWIGRNYDIIYTDYSSSGINFSNLKIFSPPNGLTFDNPLRNKFIIDKNGNKWVSCIERVSANDYLVKYDDVNYFIYPNPNFLHGFNITCLYADNQGYIWVGTQVDGLWRFDAKNATSVEAVHQSPAEFTLSTPYPNPFNAQTTISFTLTKPAKVNLSIYSLTGQKVRELAAGNYSAGNHSAVWDGKNEQGEMVSSGLYLARMESGGVSKVVRMAMVK